MNLQKHQQKPDNKSHGAIIKRNKTGNIHSFIMFVLLDTGNALFKCL